MSDTNPLRRLGELGQSPWLDNIHRAMLNDGELERLIEEDGLRGITSNPAIFEKALKDAHEYDQALRQALERDPRPDERELFYTLAARDIQEAADRLRSVYDATDRVDGMVSLEVSPDLAHDTDGTLREARELFDRLDRPNVMIKVPGTRAGLAAIESLIAEGINVNVTLLFSVERYLEVADAYLKGLEQRLNSGQPVNHIRSVASFFVSRVDSALDPLLKDRRPELQGKIAIANAKRAYRRFQELYASDRFAPLKAAGARPQRLLWASTGTKNPDYSDILYVDNLIGPDTVNTLPPATLDAFRDHGRPEITLDQGLEEAEAALEALSGLGIDLTGITDRLEREGVEAFATSFDNLLATVRQQAGAVDQ